MASEYNTDLEQDFMTEFILKYKELECLWDTTHEDYTNKYRRLQCLRELLTVLKKKEPKADIGMLKRKINSMRCAFNRQHKRHTKSRIPIDEDDPSAPIARTTRNYKLLSFLLDIPPRPKTNSEISTDNRRSSAGTEEEEIQEVYLENEFSNSDGSNAEYAKDEPGSYSEFGTSTPLHMPEEVIVVSTKKSDKKRKFSNITDSYPKRQSYARNTSYLCNNETLEPTTIKPTYNAFGEHVAEKLRCMPKEMAIYCQKVINDAIFHAEIGDLNHASRIVTEH